MTRGTRPGHSAAGALHLRWQSVGLVAVGGAVGTAAREALTLAFPRAGVFPLTVFGINVLGAFLLGVLLEGLARRGPDAGRLQSIRLLAGTGFLGGFTTYSALATDTSLLAGNGMTGAALAYGLGTVVVGGVATWAGILAGGAIANRSGAR